MEILDKPELGAIIFFTDGEIPLWGFVNKIDDGKIFYSDAPNDDTPMFDDIDFDFESLIFVKHTPRIENFLRLLSYEVL